METTRIIESDVLDGLATLATSSVHCVVTSPPYWGLRDYGIAGQLGLEATPEEFVAKIVAVFAEVRRVLRDDGTLWLNFGDTYAHNGACGGASPDGPRDVRSVIAWAKKSPMPESVTDRPTSSWEPIFLLAKSSRYFYDAEAVSEKSIHAGNTRVVTGKSMSLGQAIGAGRNPSGNGVEGSVITIGNRRNLRNVWTLGSEPYVEAHFATFPTEIPRRAIRAGTSERGACAKCGAPWTRIVERSQYVPPVAALGERNVDESRGDKTRKLSGADYNEQVRTRTLGWEAGCACGADVVPCVVLDPFLGSGTTVAVARQLGRHGIGIELNPAYARLARKRIGKAERPSTFRDYEAEVDAPLFAGMMGDQT